MLNISFGPGSRKLEELIMGTRTELMAKIAELSETVKAEAGQVKTAVDALTVIIAGLEARLGSEADFSAEIASLNTVKTSIESIYESAE